MSKPLFVFVIHAALTESLAEGAALFRQVHGDLLRVRLFATHEIEEESIGALTVAESLRAADAVFLDIRGGGKAAGICGRVLPETRQPVVLLLGGAPEMMALLRLGSFSLARVMARAEKRRAAGGPARSPNIAAMQRLTAILEKAGSLLPVGRLRHGRNWARMMRYWSHGGAENVKNLLAFAAKEYAGIKIPRKIPPPVERPDLGIYDPLADRFFDSLEAFRRFGGLQPGRPAVGLLFYGGMHFGQSVVPARCLAERLRAAGIEVLPVFAGAAHNLAAVERFFLAGGSPKVEAVVYLQWFQLTSFSAAPPEAAVNLLQRLGVPVFSGCPMYGREIAAWQASDQGLSPVETLTTVILPELDGMIAPIPTAGLVSAATDAVEGRTTRVAAIEERAERLGRRIRRWIGLRRKANSEKRIAFIIYDNPPGEESLGSAAYLDTFASLEKLFAEMLRRGYRIEGLPPQGGLHEFLLGRRLVNSPRWGGEEQALRHGFGLELDDYRRLLDGVPSGREVIGVWGEAPGEIMVGAGRIVLPAAVFGNVLLGLQPARGYHADPDKISHDQTLPPHHQYLAFYRWLEQEWKPDGIVHVGTHGTLEFLKGKEVGMSRECFPDALIGETPHLYFYHVVNASEATIAKRRSLGVLVNYNSPSFTAGGLYEEYAALDELIAECLEARAIDPARAARLEQRVAAKAAELHLAAESVAAVQEELTLMKRSIIPKGLHILGEGAAEEDRIAFAGFFLRYDRGETPSLHRLLAEARGLDYERLLCPTRAAAADAAADAAALAAIDQEVGRIVQRAWRQDELPPEEPARTAVAKALEAARRLDGALEFEHFFAALEGRYVPPGLGGDPLRNPEVLPTGRNSYQFDPRLVPSEEACRRGREIAENTLAAYLRLHGDYPKTTAVILWGFETTKTRGETVGQVLAYLGVRIASGSTPYHKRLEPIPLAELGRPRVDCLVQICGFFRDMYPNVLEMLDRAFRLVSDLEEPPEQNSVRRNTLHQKEALKGRVPEERREKIAAGRIFGPKPGEYGTRTIQLIETGAWKREEEIADLFSATMGHLYADTIHGERRPEAYRGRLAEVDLVSQVRDSHEYEIMDLDHYYEFFGGLSRTVEALRGRAPAMLISDTTKEVIRTETVGESLHRGIRTRLLNPVWIDALLAHDVHGAQKISDRVQYLIGFAATTHAVENWVWSAVTDRYVRDEEMFRRMAQNNRFAVEELLKRLAEAEGRAYWQATEEERALLRKRYLELEEWIEEKTEP